MKLLNDGGQFPKIKLLVIFGLSGIFLITIDHVNVTPLWNQLLMAVKEMGFWGSILFITIYNIATLLFIPGSLATDLASVDQSNYDLDNTSYILSLTLRILGLLATILLTLYFNKLAKKALKDNLENGEKNR